MNPVGPTFRLDAPRVETKQEPATHFPSGPVRTIADAVGLLHVRTADNHMTACTASLVAPDIVLVPAHCVSNSGPARAVEAAYFPGNEPLGTERKPQPVEVEPEPLEINPRLDYALLQLSQEIEGVKPLILESKAPEAGENLFLVGHPLALEKTVVQKDCSALDPATDEDRLLHSCETSHGSAGSVIASRSSPGFLVAMHQSAGRDAKSGVLFSALLRESPILAALARAQ